MQLSLCERRCTSTIVTELICSTMKWLMAVLPHLCGYKRQQERRTIVGCLYRKVKWSYSLKNWKYSCCGIALLR